MHRARPAVRYDQTHARAVRRPAAATSGAGAARRARTHTTCPGAPDVTRHTGDWIDPRT